MITAEALCLDIHVRRMKISAPIRSPTSMDRQKAKIRLSVTKYRKLYQIILQNRNIDCICDKYNNNRDNNNNDIIDTFSVVLSTHIHVSVRPLYVKYITNKVVITALNGIKRKVSLSLSLKKKQLPCKHNLILQCQKTILPVILTYVYGEFINSFMR